MLGIMLCVCLCVRWAMHTARVSAEKVMHCIQCSLVLRRSLKLALAWNLRWLHAVHGRCKWKPLLYTTFTIIHKIWYKLQFFSTGHFYEVTPDQARSSKVNFWKLLEEVSEARCPYHPTVSIRAMNAQNSMTVKTESAQLQINDTEVKHHQMPGHSGLAVTFLTAVWQDQGSNLTVGSCRFFVKTTTIYRLGDRLHTLTAVPRLTQPSTLCRMVNEYQLSGWVIIINGDGECGFWQPTGGLAARVVWPGLRVGGLLAPFHIHHMNQVNSRSGFELRWQHHKHCRCCYYYYYYYYHHHHHHHLIHCRPRHSCDLCPTPWSSCRSCCFQSASSAVPDNNTAFSTSHQNSGDYLQDFLPARCRSQCQIDSVKAVKDKNKINHNEKWSEQFRLSHCDVFGENTTTWRWTMEQFTATSQRCWLTIQSVPVVTKDTVVWIVGPWRSVSYFNCAG